MLKKTCAIILTLFTSVISFASGIHYPALLISDSLKKEARMVKRYEELVIDIKSPSRAVIHRKYAYTILNESGDGFATFADYYDKFHSINSIDGTLYDAMGKELKSVKKKDIQDLSGTGEESLIQDTRFKTHNFYYNSYPYTVEYEVEDELDGLMNLPTWHPLTNAGVAIEDAKLIVITPSDYQFRFKQFNYNGSPVITQDRDKKVYTWELKNLYAIKGERWMPELYEVVPEVLVGLTDFSAQGYKENMSSWQEYGKFFYDLLKGRDVLPDNIKQKVHELTDNVKDPKEKVYILYDFLQKNTRYISIQLGIGGLQPFDATFTATKRYGDCKALSNYMVALLKEAGIKANSVIINSGEDAAPVIEDFPSDQFNHVIACVPMQKDTIWLECTSQTTSPGYMGKFTGGRKGLLVDETGGYLVSTPTYTSKDNLQLRKVVATVDDQGNLNADVHTTFTGEQQELQHDLIHSATKDQREKYLNTFIDLPTYKVEKNDYSEVKGAVPAVTEQLNISAPTYATVSGKRLFVVPNLFNKQELKLQEGEERKYDIENRDAYKDIDTVEITIPAGYTVEALPKEVSISNKFGTYSSSVKFDNNKITLLRMHEQLPWHFPKSDYPELVKFYNEMYKTDHSKIVFVKKDS